MAYRKEELAEVPHFREGETFVFHIPYNLDELDCKLNRKAQFYELPWSPWPDQKHIERQVGDFILKLHPTETFESGWGRNRTKQPYRLIRHIDDPPDEWMVFCGSWGKHKELGIWTFNRRHVLGVMKEDYPELKITNGRANTPGNRMISQLRTPPVISDALLKKVYGRSHPRVDQRHTNFENVAQTNEFQLQLEWYRKHLLKIQRKRANKKKKQKAKELGVTVQDINEQKRKERKIAKQVQLTQEWIDMSGDVHKTIDFLQEVVKQMGQRERLDREWYDEGRRAMRELANTMRPLNKHFPKKK